MARSGPPAKAELELMLPGFRFLFAAIVLSMSILIFGLGAAALLRAAHDQFASIPSRRALPEPVFAQQPAFAQQIETPAATLAMLRVEPPVVEKALEQGTAAAFAAVEPALVEPAPEAVPVPPVETARLAALRVDDPAPSEPAKPETATKPEPTPPTEAALAQAATPAAAEEIKVAAVEPATPSVTAAAAPVLLEPVIAPPAPESIGAATKIAALGSPAVTVEGPATAKPASAQADRSAIRKRQQARRAKERRRLAAQRARLAREAAAALLLQQQQQADPFAPQPTITTATATPTRRR